MTHASLNCKLGPIPRLYDEAG